MARSVAMLRAINLGSTRRVPMPELRELLTDAGYADVTTYVQSGNIALTTTQTPAKLEASLAGLIERRFGFAVPVIVRTGSELEAVVKLDPLGEIVDDPKRYQVSFLSDELPAEKLEQLQERVAEPERLVADGRELYAWHPAGVAGSKLWSALAGASLGVTATARNWTTVLKLLQMSEPG